MPLAFPVGVAARGLNELLLVWLGSRTPSEQGGWPSVGRQNQGLLFVIAPGQNDALKWHLTGYGHVAAGSQLSR